MTIRVYPSRLESEPLETHEVTSSKTISEWIRSVAPDFSLDAESCHPTVVLNGETIAPELWDITEFSPSDRLDIYIEARGIAIAIVYAIALVAAFAIMQAQKPGTPQDRQKGNTLEDPGALANSVRWGDPIPEIAGAPIIYPDYIIPPRRYYVGKTQQWVDSLVCIGVGTYLTDNSQVWIGDTAAPSLGDNLQLRIFPPGETIPAPYNEWWHTPEEVGFTTLGGSGMTLGPSSQITPTWTGVISFAGATITGNIPPPESWAPGLFVRVEAEHPLIFDGSSIQSELLDTLQLGTGDDIELTGERAGIYTISSIIPGVGGSTGAPATATGSAAPARYDFGVTQATLVITLGSGQYTVVLTTTVAGLSGLITAINAQLNGTPVRARESAGVLEIFQMEPYSGEQIALSGDVSDLMGTPTVINGIALSLPTGTKYIISGADFGTGGEIASAGTEGLLYEITNISSNVVTVAPPDIQFWAGFPSSVSNTTSNVTIDQGSIEGGWVGPFAAVPKDEKANKVEVDIFYPQGLIRYNKKGRIRSYTAGGVIQWRYIGDVDWIAIPFSNTESTPDQIGFTYAIDLPTPGRVEVRVRSEVAPSDSASVSDKQQWTGLRARIVGAPTNYPQMTVMHVRMRTGDKVSGSVENKIAMRAMRILPTIADPEVLEPTRDIAPYFIHMMSTVGYGRDMIDMEHLASLHEIWHERGDVFDLSVNSSSTLKTVANYCLNAGFSELTLVRGKISAARDAYRMGTPTHIYSPQELTEQIVESTESIMPDDIDGVDVEYIDYATGRTLTEQYRLIGDEGNRVEKIKCPGVTGRTQAWRLAARRRREAAYRRTVYSGSTELAAMNSFYMDYVGLQDGIPEWGQSAFVMGQDGTSLTLSEHVQSVDGDMIAMIRRSDGTASAPVPVESTDGHILTLAQIPPDVTISTDPNRPTVVYMGSRTQTIHEALMTEIRPDGEASVEFQAVNYDSRVYVDDDMGPDQIILTSMPYLYDIGSDMADASLAVTGITKTRMVRSYSIDPEEADASLAVTGITKTRQVFYLTYDITPEEADASLAVTGITKTRLVKYTTYSIDPEEADASIAVTGITKTRQVSYLTYDITPEEADASIAVTGITKTREL